MSDSDGLIYDASMNGEFINEQLLLSYKGVVAFIGLFLLFIVERRLPAAKPVSAASDKSRRLGRNLSLWGINALMSPLLVIPLTMLATTQGAGWRDSGPVSVWWMLPIDILLLDLWLYVWHRANHQVAFLWRFHQVHHQDVWLDVTSSVRFHFGEVALSALARLPVIWLAGVPLMSVIIFETLVLIMAGFQHSNLRLPQKIERGMSRVVITPAIHWVHHHVLRSDTNSNYGTLFSFWDRLFGSMSSNKRSMTMNLGLDDTPEETLPLLLVRPFRRAGR